MIDRSIAESRSAPHAELTGIVPQLTTPSRHQATLVDIWLGLRWNERDAEWEECFTTLAKGRRPDGDTPSFFDLFSHSSSRGLIAARQVSANPSVWTAIEEEARALVQAVNRDVAARRAPPAAPESEGRRWALRVRGAAAFLASLRWISDSKPRLPSVTDLPIQVSRGQSASR
jgi:hypothetical protein